MDVLRLVAIVSLLVVAIVAGGAAVRLAMAVIGARAALVTLALVALALAIGVVSGAGDRRWRYNPYW